MKTLLTTVVLLGMVYGHSISQSIGDIKLADINAEFMQLTFDDRIGNKVSVNIDYGQASIEYNPRDTQLKTESRKAMEFNSIMDAINFLGRYDYELIDVYTLTKETSSTPFYILQRKAHDVR